MEASVTAIYVGLIAWGVAVGIRQILRAHKRPSELLNPLFEHPVARRILTVHIVIASADLFVVGPWSVANKSTLWYWGGRIALLLSAMPLVAHLNRGEQSYGKLMYRFATTRNIVAFALHVAVAARVVDWFHYYLLLWWLVGFRYLDVGPRRAIQTLYDTRDKLAARPWAPQLNFAVSVLLYGLAFLAVYNRQILFASVPSAATPVHAAAAWEHAVVWGANVALLLWTWMTASTYVRTRSRPA